MEHYAHAAALSRMVVKCTYNARWLQAVRFYYPRKFHIAENELRYVIRALRKLRAKTRQFRFRGSSLRT